MADGRLVPPNLDDRTWQDIVNEVKRLIPRYAPQWTDHNASDLGITLVELFAWLVEGLIYRLNRVPEKNFIEFLNLMGITRDPATPASTPVTFTVLGTSSKMTIPKGTKVATPQSPTEEPVIFETDATLEALPINLQHALLLPRAGGGYSNYSKRLITGPVDDPAQATTLSINAGATLALGFSGSSAAQLDIFFDFVNRAPDATTEFKWTFSQGNAAPHDWPTVEPANDGTLSLTRSGIVSLTIPPSWQAQASPLSPSDAVTDPYFWVGLQNTSPNAPIALTMRRVGFNTVSATNALTVNVQHSEAEAEFLGTSTGQPSQTFILRNPPLYKQPRVPDPYAHLEVEVGVPTGNNTFGSWTRWTRVDDFPPSSDEVPGGDEVYKCNPVTGDIIFGDYDPAARTGRGKIPPQGHGIRARTYRYVVGGVRGNVPPHTISVVRDPPPDASGVTVVNPRRAHGGSDQESIEETKRRAPEALKNRDRAVTLADYEYLAREASTDVKKVRALPERTDAEDFGGLPRSTGHLNVIIVPAAADARDARPRPEEDLLVEVSDYLQPRRPATVHLHVHGPRYLPIRVHAEVKVWSSAIRDGLIKDTDTYRETIISTLQDFLHPTRGKQDGLGWEVGESVYVHQIFAAIQPPPALGFIAKVTLEAVEPADYGPGVPTERPEEVTNPAVKHDTWVRLADYELVCYGGANEDMVAIIQ